MLDLKELNKCLTVILQDRDETKDTIIILPIDHNESTTSVDMEETFFHVVKPKLEDIFSFSY